MSSSVKILIACDRPGPLPPGDIFAPIHVGAALSRNGKELAGIALRDDTGDNISRKNRRYNELTAVYWAWKNYGALGNPDYVGLMHYRRHFIFDKWRKPPDGSWTFNTDLTGEALWKLTKCQEESIISCLSENDILYAGYPAVLSVREQFGGSPFHRSEDLEACGQIIQRLFPDCHTAFQRYLRGKINIFGNMFIMRRELFFEYCHWLFSILREFDQSRNYKDLSQEEARFFVSERLSGAFISRKLEEGHKGESLSVALLTNCAASVKPAFSDNTTAIIFIVTGEYLPIFQVALSSLVNSSSSAANYDIIVLEDGIGLEDREACRGIAGAAGNISLRFVAIGSYLKNKEPLIWKKDNKLMRPIIWSRFFSGGILEGYEKALCLDCDILIKRDISELCSIPLDGNWLGAAPDLRWGIFIKYNHKIKKRKFGDYARGVLGITEPFAYFQTGVMLFDLAAFRANRLDEKLLSCWRKLKKSPLGEKDVFNAVFYGHVKFLPLRWSAQWHLLPLEAQNYKKELPPRFWALYRAALASPALIHYSSEVKPWNCISRPLSDEWWREASGTPVYWELLVSSGKLVKPRVRKFKPRVLARVVKRVAPRFLWPALKKIARLVALSN